MDRFEYLVVTWPAAPGGPYSVDQLDQLGSEGWEAVGMTSRPTSVLMPGMGATPDTEIAVLLKRQLRPPRTRRSAPLQA